MNISKLDNKLELLLKYYPKTLEKYENITDDVVNKLYTEYKETIDILIEVKMNYDDVHHPYKPKIFETPRCRLRNAARTRSKRKGQNFNLIDEDVKLVRICPILNKPINYYNNVCSLDSPSLDRIDNDKGYFKDNIQIISMMSNNMKASASPETIIIFSKNILNIYG